MYSFVVSPRVDLNELLNTSYKSLTDMMPKLLLSLLFYIKKVFVIKMHVWQCTTTELFHWGPTYKRLQCVEDMQPLLSIGKGLNNQYYEQNNKHLTPIRQFYYLLSQLWLISNSCIYLLNHDQLQELQKDEIEHFYIS